MDPHPDDAGEQDAVLRRKDRVTKSGIGLQQWGDPSGSDEAGEEEAPAGQSGTAGTGTAERQARIGAGQARARREHEALEDES